MTVNFFQLHPHKSLIEKKLLTYLGNEPEDDRKLLHQAMCYAISGQSKLVRPILVLACADVLDINMDHILPLACAVEYIHSYSLIHDDLPCMDDDDLRRGRPSCHKKFNEATAILAGDTLQIFAIECLLEQLSKYFKASQVLLCVKHLCYHCGIMGMAGGQQLDLLSHESSITKSKLATIHRLKTGALLYACVECCCTLSDAKQPHIESLKAFGESYGLLFQAADDLLDLIGDAQRIGKTPNKDIKSSKGTLLSLGSEADARAHIKKLQQECHAHLTALTANTRSLVDLVDATVACTY